MREGLGWRFALEVVFLIALAFGLGVAELSPAAIVVVMVLAWLLVCLLEVAVWAEGVRLSVVRRTAVAEEPDEVTPTEAEEPAAVTEIREAEPEARRSRFWRRRRAAAS